MRENREPVAEGGKEMIRVMACTSWWYLFPGLEIQISHR
jgi:hypothetical protein